MYAAVSGNLAIVDFLIRNGADCTVENNVGPGDKQQIFECSLLFIRSLFIQGGATAEKFALDNGFQQVVSVVVEKFDSSAVMLWPV